MKKSYRFTEENTFWNTALKPIYTDLNKEFPNMETVMNIGKDKDLREHITKGTGTSQWDIEEIRMALEAIFVLKFQKENPKEHDRIPVEEIRGELRDEFCKINMNY